MEFVAGAARREITPPPGEALGGFIARNGPATGAAGPLHVRAAVLRRGESAYGESGGGESACAVIQADVLGFSPWQVTEVREFAAARLGLARDSVLISATHTHSGPAIVPIRGTPMASPEYCRSVVAAMQDALQGAHDACAPATLETGRFNLEFGVNRRQETPEGVVLGIAADKPSPGHGYVARISRAGQTILLYSYACHPYILGGDNLLASGDFPAVASQHLEEDASTVALFLNGCAGNIAPLAAFQGMEALQHEGERLARAVRGSRLSPQEVTGLHSSHRVISLPLAPLPSQQEITAIAAQQEHVVRPSEKEEEQVQHRLLSAIQDWSEQMRRIVQLRLPLTPVHCELQALRIGPLVLLGISGEPFFEIGEQLRASGSGREVWPLGYTNAFCGYIPTQSELAGGGYEVEDSWKFLSTWRLHESAEQVVVKSARDVLSRV